MTVQIPRPQAETVLKAAAAPTSAFTGYVTDWLYVGGLQDVDFLLDYVKGDETNIKLEVQIGAVVIDSDGSYEDPTTPRTVGVVAASVSGDSQVDKHKLTLLPGNFDTTDATTVRWRNATGATAVRLRAMKNGGSAPGTLAVSAIGL